MPPVQPSRTPSQNTFYYLFILWLGVVFAVPVYSGFVFAKKKSLTSTGPNLKIAERLAVVATFSDGLSESTKQQLLNIAVQLETVPEHLAILKGEAASLSDYEHLSESYQLLGRYQTDRDKVKPAETETLLNSAKARFGISLGWLMTIGTTAFLLVILGKAEKTPQGSPTQWRAWSILGLFWAWFGFNSMILVPMVYSVTSDLGELTFTILAQLAGYLLLATMLKQGQNRKEYDLFQKFSPGWIGRGYFLALAGTWSINVLVTNLAGEPPTSNNPLLAIFAKAEAWQVVILAALVIVVGPLFEELVFRAWLLGGLKERWGTWPALLLSAGFFAIVHSELQATPALFGLGLVFGWVYLRSGSVWASTAVHAMWNATTVGFLIAGLP